MPSWGSLSGIDVAGDTIQSFRPWCKIILRHREDDAAGGLQQPGDIDITDKLADTGAVQIVRTLDCMSQFNIQLQDIPSDFYVEDTHVTHDSLYGYVEIMDVVIIYLARELIGEGPEIPVLRGFVRDVQRSESISQDGRPIRIVQISGHCLGSAFTIQQIGRLQSILQGGQQLPWTAYMAVSEMIPRKMDAWLFQSQAIDVIEKMIASAGFTMEFETDTTYDHTYVTPLSIDPEIGPVWDLMVDFADLPFHELFVKQNKNNPVLVYRNTPWMEDLDTDPPSSKTVFLNEIISIDSHRTDAHVANGNTYRLANYILGGAWYNIQLGENNIGFETSQNRIDIFGARIIQTSGRQLKEVAHNLPEDEQLKSDKDNFNFIEERRKKLMKWMERNSDLEDGSITIRGRDDIIPGDYVLVARGQLSYYIYVVAVQHEFIPYHRYTTTLQFIRSTGYIKRKRVTNPWQKERF